MKSTINLYFLLAIITTVLFPFTGIIALDHVLKAKKLGENNADVLNLELEKTYYWIKVTFITMAVAYVVLGVTLVGMYSYSR
ncbi:MAG: hypothetical protein RR212_11515 [Bacteroidales bacterium]